MRGMVSLKKEIGERAWEILSRAAPKIILDYNSLSYSSEDAERVDMDDRRRFLMAQPADYLAENDFWYARLEELVDRMSDEDLVRPMPAGWTPASVLGHLAFWDLRIVTLLKEWESAGAVSASEIDAGVINEVSRRLLLAIPPRTVARLALEWARAANLAIAGLSPSKAAEVCEKAPNVRLDRAHHRQTHIEDIKRILGATNI